MDLTHIYLVFREFSNGKDCEITLFDDAGLIVDPCPISVQFDTSPIIINNRNKLTTEAHETIIRILTRQVTTVDVSMRTPIFF